MISFHGALQALYSGILVGGYYALISIGLAFTFGIMKIINLTHGEYVLIGGYLAYWLFRGLSFGPFLSLPLAIAFLFGVGLLVYILLIQKIREAPELNTLILTYGIGIFLTNSLLQLWSADYRLISIPWFEQGVSLWGLKASIGEMVSFTTAILLIGFLYWWLIKTYTGKAIRALSEDRDAASLMGINVKKMDLLAFAIGAAAAGAAGPLYATLHYIYPGLGPELTIKAFIITVLGGVGSIAGIILAGIILGVAESFTVTLLSSSYPDLIGFILFILILLFRPSGLMGRTVYRG